MKNGDSLRLVDGEKEYMGEIINLDKKELLVEIKEENEDKFSTKVKVDLAMGLIKNDRFELSIQKLTELGINKIIPLKTERTIIKIKEKKEKWDIVSKEALKQCQGVSFVEFSNPLKVEEIKFEDYDLILIPYEKNLGLKLREVLNNYDRTNIKRILYIIGPEGGFTTEEIDYLRARGEVISLGNRILRAETAAIVVGGILINEFN